MEEEKVNESSPVDFDDIAADGDVILIVGLEKTRKLRVHSLFLKTTSEAFKAMLGPHFSEGQRLNNDNPKEIPMPEDNPEALKVICAVIHHCYNAQCENLSPRDILQVAIAADKYFCTTALQNASGHWLKPHTKQSTEDLSHLMAAAYLFDNAQAFREVTQALVLRHEESYISLAPSEVGSVLPWWTFCRFCMERIKFGTTTTNKSTGLLEEQRGRLRLLLEQLLVKGLSVATCSYHCEWYGVHIHAYVKLIADKELWPEHLIGMPISRAIECLELMDDPVPNAAGLPCEHARWHRRPSYRLDRKDDLEKLKEQAGLCLDCVRKSSQAHTEDCRTP
jgi:BTB/POZ domain